ncbi:protein LIKE EARLY STARVATION, chloroplastic [Quercus suber]|uniref:Uncharacterized protein n=1 Tax=Quercus suber TaxID=58331 RepID=A0AAW0L2Q4_QUESU
MASHIGSVNARALQLLPPHFHTHSQKHPLVPLHDLHLLGLGLGERSRLRLRVRVSDGDDSYLHMWKNAVDKERKSIDFQNIAHNSPPPPPPPPPNDHDHEDLEKKTLEFHKILQVSKEERDRIQRMQVIDRAAAAIAAARAILNENASRPQILFQDLNTDTDATGLPAKQQGTQNESIFVPRSESSQSGTPGPDFWSWAPPVNSDISSDDVNDTQIAGRSSVYPTSNNPVVEKDWSVGVLSIPFESTLSESNPNYTLPPLQSFIEVEKVETSEASLGTPYLEEEREHGVQFSAHAAEAAHALHKMDGQTPHGVNPDGSRWWKETGIERRPDGVICRWTMTRGVSADQVVEWQEKFWEAADEFGYKELGSEKSGRDATGNVWREYWRESMRQEHGLVHLEKTADKWGKNGNGDEWQEKWWEHYDASGQAEKWAHKWCSIDPNTLLEAGHAHIWHERWGEKYDGHGGSIKYTDKWAERCEGDGWTKWGDKWDENFDLNSHGVKQGETWWEGKYGERWNRTWGEGHNGSGWVHKYGKSSSGEHWDTHAQQDTWYERYPHYGFYHCFENSVQLREVQKPSEMS